MGTHNRSAFGILVDRTTRYVILIHLAHGRSTEHFRDALIAAISTLPVHLRRSLTCDQGIEMGRHGEFTAATNVPVYFCDPASPWQRGSNENTNGLLRQHFPKGTDLNIHTAERLTAVAAELNGRPLARKVPLITAKQLLDWTDGKNASSFSSITWRGGTLSFNVRVGAGARGITAMLPAAGAGGATLTAVSTGAKTVPLTRTTVKGIEYALFPATTGAYTATYSGGG